MEREHIFGTIGFILGAAAGATIAWFLVKDHYQKLTESEIAEAREYYAKLHKTGKYESLEKLASVYAETQKSYQEGLDRLGYTSDALTVDDAPDGTPEEREAWLNRAIYSQDLVPQDDDPEAEYHDISDRLGNIYIISFEEFGDPDVDYPTISMTYYEGDDTLADEREDIEDDVSGLIGDDALDHFGDRSRDKNIVYVRNDNKSLDIEICRNPGKYSVEVLSMEDPRPIKVRKMRDEE